MAESRVEMQTAKWVAEGMVKGVSRVFHDVRAYVSCRGYVGIPLRVRLFCRKSRWHRGFDYSSLIKHFALSRAFLSVGRSEDKWQKIYEYHI